MQLYSVRNVLANSRYVTEEEIKGNKYLVLL